MTTLAIIWLRSPAITRHAWLLDAMCLAHATTLLTWITTMVHANSHHALAACCPRPATLTPRPPCLEHVIGEAVLVATSPWRTTTMLGRPTVAMVFVCLKAAHSRKRATTMLPPTTMMEVVNSARALVVSMPWLATMTPQRCISTSALVCLLGMVSIVTGCA